MVGQGHFLSGEEWDKPITATLVKKFKGRHLKLNRKKAKSRKKKGIADLRVTVP